MGNRKEPAADQVKEVTVPEALKLGIHAGRIGDNETARKIFERVLAIMPDHPDALHFLGVVKWAESEKEDAIALVERSVALQPEMADWRNNLANMYLRMDRAAEARSMYLGVIAQDPQHASAWTNLGLVERLADNPEAAEKAFRTALARNAKFGDAHLALAKLLYSENRVAEATQHLYQAIASNPSRAGGSRALLSRAYCSLGEQEKAVQVLRDWCEAEPDNLAAKHYLSAFEKTPPERAERGYVESVFDDYAVSFDASLARLGYRAPQLITDILKRVANPPDGSLVGLDAGCGTGLVGPLVAPYFARLDGVDLSSKMMEYARSRNVYAELRHAELTADMDAHPGAYDVIISADTLLYIGAQEPVMAAAYRALKPGGLLLFTLECEDTDAVHAGYRLQIHGRYCHRESYIRACIEAAGLEVIEITRDTLRHEAGLPVPGFLVTAKRP